MIMFSLHDYAILLMKVTFINTPKCCPPNTISTLTLQLCMSTLKHCVLHDTNSTFISAPGVFVPVVVLKRTAVSPMFTSGERVKSKRDTRARKVPGGARNAKVTSTCAL